MNETLELAKKLMSCPSVTPHDAECQSILGEKLSALGFHCESLRFGEVDNLWARYGKEAPLLVFAGHTDVVPPGPETQWSSPPFQPDIRNDKLYGRGAVDMKAAIAAMVTAVHQFLSSNQSFSGSIGFLLTSDEEGPAINGTAKVMETLLSRGEKIDYCVIGEPSCDKEIGDQVRVGRRGSLHGQLTIYGKQGHVAHPHLADNPIHKSVFALHELAHTQWDQGNEYYPPTTFQISNIHAGNGAANVIPGELDILCNFRFSNAVTVEELQHRSESILKKHGLSYDMQWKIGAQPFLTKKGKLLTAVQQAISDVTGITTRLSTGGGTSDGRFIAPTGTEVVELGVTNATAHHIDEHVSLPHLITLEKIYHKILTLVLHKKI